MIKILLSMQVVTIKVYGDSNSQHKTIVIKNGSYNKKLYRHLVLAEGNLVLEGEEMAVLASSAKVLSIEMENIERKIAKLIGNEEIYLRGIDAVPEGREREIIKNLINYS